MNGRAYFYLNASYLFSNICPIKMSLKHIVVQGFVFGKSLPDICFNKQRIFMGMKYILIKFFNLKEYKNVRNNKKYEDQKGNSNGLSHNQ